MTARGSRPVVAFAGGGTGGHLFPGLAVARWLRDADPGLRIVFFTTGRPLERRLLGGGEFEVVRLRGRASPARWWGWPLTGASQVTAGLGALGALRRLGVSVLVTLGGYGSVAPGLAAWSLGRPVVALEQNSIPGRATKLLSLVADVVCTTWPEAVEGLWRRAYAVTTGNPLRPEVLRGEAERARRSAWFHCRGPVLLVLGGSQGSRAVNRWVTNSLPALARELPHLQIVHQAGELDYPWVAQAYRGVGLRAWVKPFLPDIGDFYALASVAVARAGATTLSELAAVGLATVLVPYPYATDDHQRANAHLAADRGAAVVVEEADFERTSLVALVRELLGDRARRRRMAAALRAMARPQATRLVGQCVTSLLLHPHAQGAAMVAGNGR